MDTEHEDYPIRVTSKKQPFVIIEQELAWILDSYTYHFYGALLMHADNETQQCFPSQRRLARITGMTTRQVRRCTGNLEDLGLLVKLYEAHGRGLSNVYLLTEVPTEIHDLAVEMKETGLTVRSRPDSDAHQLYLLELYPYGAKALQEITT